MTESQAPQVFTPEEVAAHLRVHRDTVYSLLRIGTLQAKKVGGQWRITADNLRAYMDSPGQPKEAH